MCWASWGCIDRKRLIWLIFSHAACARRGCGCAVYYPFPLSLFATPPARCFLISALRSSFLFICNPPSLDIPAVSY